MRVCSKCHDPSNAAEQDLDAAGWKDLVNQMAANGAQGGDADFDAIASYLTKAFPRSRGRVDGRLLLRSKLSSHLTPWIISKRPVRRRLWLDIMGLAIFQPFPDDRAGAGKMRRMTISGPPESASC